VIPLGERIGRDNGWEGESFPLFSLLPNGVGDEESRAAVDAGGNVAARRNSSRPKWYSERVVNVLIDLSKFSDSLAVPRPRMDGPVRG
jgi:hypothetical protein